MQVIPVLVSCDLSANFKKLKEKKAVHSAFNYIYNLSDYIFKSSLISICIIIIINSFLLLLGYKPGINLQGYVLFWGVKIH